ncbi:protein of unknown function [Granulicella rosea]|uniref:DUF4160 domain-containing protein n=1 Tax=Granulicella rosea TaxID=474952 RepID=A0A239L2F1_9BACT|nr:DUF4160 domain-containing protein [Granulicella rosea]SNT24787.1 protein of unknown function [Granulicella rosea]
MGLLRFDGVRFTVYTMEHEPRRVHGFYGEVEVIVDLRPDGTVSLVNRTNAIRTSSATKDEVKHVLAVAAAHFQELARLWEARHG